ncbi:unnamed protein product [Calypogeia fissa]
MLWAFEDVTGLYRPSPVSSPVSTGGKTAVVVLLPGRPSGRDRLKKRSGRYRLTALSNPAYSLSNAALSYRSPANGVRASVAVVLSELRTPKGGQLYRSFYSSGRLYAA